MSKKKDNTEAKKDILLYDDHKLVTRRDFLSSGMISMSTFALAPTLLSLLKSNSAYALECNTAQATIGKTPVIIFDLSGGANLVGSNVMVGGPGGQMDFLATYETLGLPMDMHPSKANQLSSELGLAFHGDSAILRGIVSETSGNVRPKVDGAVFCTSSGDDTANNPHNPIYWLNKAGAMGGLTQLAGTSNSISGGKSIVPDASIDPTVKPVVLNRPQDALGLVNIGKLGELFTPQKAQRILKAIERMSEQKIMSYGQKSLPDQIKDLVKCGYIGSQDLIGKYTADALDASKDPMVTQVFDNLNNGDQRKVATMMKLLMDGHLGVATIEKGGYDYHNNTRATGETRDFEAGALIGRCIELASLKGKDLVVYVITDGGVAAREGIDNSVGGRGKLSWTGDSGQRSSTFMLVYRNLGRATLRNGNRQIGSFKDTGAVENAATPSSNSVVNLAKLITANYLALHGEENKLAAIVGDNPFGANLDKYLVFNKIT
ncbi:MAG: general secretion pathway protein GspF [Bdellovibrio sp. CG_4_9_14_3_um_filter_39_7]|nr:MAG: general secretion pathway protein GspF [Bdellovibrio sp. CG_4_9_14_3_um_filter_39_7]